MRDRLRIKVGIMLCFCMLFLQGCTKEKAEAIESAAQNYRIEATAALTTIRNILNQNIAMPARDNEKLAGDLQQTDFTYEMLQTLLTEDQIGSEEAGAFDKQIDQIQAHYDALAEMYDALPQGHFFAADAVEKSQRHAVNLTLQMINLARLLEQQKIPVRLNAKRILLVEQIRQHNAIPDTKLKQEHLMNAAKQVVALGVEETQLRQQAIAQCLKAAETGALLTGLIRDYKTLSVAEILALTEQTLGFVAQISGQNADVAALLNRYQGVENKIRADPYWNKLLDAKVEVPTVK